MRAIKDIKYQPELIDLQTIEISKYNTRYERIDKSLIEALKQSILERGYDENFPILVAYIGDSSQGEVLGGGHRFIACKELNIKQIPANVYRGISKKEAVVISYDNNKNQQTFKPETFLDLAYQIYRLNKEDGETLEAIGQTLGMSKANVGFHFAIVEGLDPGILQLIEDTLSTQVSDLVDTEDEGLVDEKSTRVDKIDWQLKWFRYITPLRPKYQRKMVEEKIIANTGKLSTKKLEEYYKVYKKRQFLEDFFASHLSDESLNKCLEMVESGAYDNSVEVIDREYMVKQSLQDIVGELISKSRSRFENDDFRKFIPTLENQSIDCLLTDPPYGKEYKSNRKQDKTDEINQPIEGDELEKAKEALSDCLESIDCKMKENSHCYIFCDWKIYPEFKAIIEKYFGIKNLIIWHKNNHGSGDVRGSYSPTYECIIFGVKGEKSLCGEKRPDDVISAKKVGDNEKKHPTEKPIELLKFLLQQSCGPGEVVCDPFAGVASTLVAAKGLDLGYVGCEIDPTHYEKGKLRLLEE